LFGRFLHLLLFFTAVLAVPAPAAAASVYHLCPLTCDESITVPPEGEARSEGIRTGTVAETDSREAPDAAFEPVAAEKIPPPTGEVAIVIDVRNHTLTIMSDGRPYRQFPCAVGKNETPSPTGNWKIKRKAAHWGTGFGTRWMGLSVPWGIYGIHGTNKPGSIGSQASHGCFRMFNRHVETIYPWVKVGTPVHVIGNPLGPNPRPELVLNSREPAVVEIQRSLSRLGYYEGPIDGIFGPAMEKAVIQFRKDHGLRYDNRVLDDFYEALGL